MKKRLEEEEKYLTEKDKYYTPTIEEFCIGFEYEAKNSENRKKAYDTIDYYDFLSDWTFYIYTGLSEGYEGMTEISDIKNGNVDIRVKYLDKEDIESLGFKDISLCDGQEFIKDNITIKYYDWSWDSPKGLIMIRVIEDGVSFYNFSGHLKNKSELKRLLKQFQIETSTS